MMRKDLADRMGILSRDKKYRNIADRLLSKILVNQETGCWEWQGAKFKKVNGYYGQIRMDCEGKSKNRFAHRISYIEFIGPIPNDLELDHVCRNTLCINPEHLEPVTHTENMRRRIDINKPHCIHGHEYTPENTFINARGRRECRTCIGIKGRLFYQKKKNLTNSSL